jgi:hypothetical protein
MVRDWRKRKLRKLCGTPQTRSLDATLGQQLQFINSRAVRAIDFVGSIHVILRGHSATDLLS